MSSDKNPFEAVYGKTGKILPPRSDAPRGNTFRVLAGDGTVYYAYKFPHPSVAASVVLYDESKKAFLLIMRSIDPYKNHFAFPGGFLEVGKEEIEAAAARELREETGVRVNPEDLLLVDIRSHPQRDPRDHVLDIAYYARMKDVTAYAGEETIACKWATVAELDIMSLAFDHDVLWARVKSRFVVV